MSPKKFCKIFQKFFNIFSLVKKGAISEAEQSFKDAAVLADQVVDDIAKNVIQTQLAQIQKYNEKQTEVKEDSK